MPRVSTLAAAFASLAARGDHTALIGVEGAVSYAALSARANRLANALIDAGVEPGDRFAFALSNCPRIIECYIACARSGIVAAPLSLRLTASEFAFQLRDCGAVGLLYGEAASELVAEARPELDLAFLAGPDDTLLAHGRDGECGRAPKPGDAYCIMYTGGTTGTSKATVQTQRSWAACVESVAEKWTLRPHDRHLVALPMSHVAWFSAAAQLYAGGTAILLDKWDPALALDLVERERVTTLNMIPTMLGDLIQAKSDGRPRDLSSLRQLTVAGSTMPEEMYRRARDAFGPIIGNIYGMTETSGPVTYALPTEMEGRRVRCVGRPAKSVELAILAEDGEAACGESGEIALRGPQVTPGYLNRPTETELAFRDGWFLTGDVGYVDPEGFVYVLDRSKDMIKSGGLNVYPREVEEVLYAHPDVVEAAVIGVADTKWIEAVHAVVVVRAASSVSESEIIAHCRAHLAGHKTPKAVHFREAIPRTPVGKFDKKKLRADYA